MLQTLRTFALQKMRSLVFLLFLWMPSSYCAETTTTTTESHAVCSLPCNPNAAGTCRQCSDTNFECPYQRLTVVCSSYFNASSTNMSDVVLFDNELTDFKSFPESVLRLQKLDLRRNKFGAFAKADFARFPNIQHLLLCGNKVKSLPKDVFEALPQLGALKLNGMDLDSLDNDTFKSNRHLNHLELAGNKLSKVPASAFPKDNHITYLDLSRNPITQLQVDDFGTLTRLLHLSLENLDIYKIKEKTFAPLAELQYISLDFNAKLSFIDEDAFGCGPQSKPDKCAGKLNSFSVGACHLGSLDFHVVNWKRLTEAKLQKNPWDCDCTMKWVLSPDIWNGLGHQNAFNETVLPKLREVQCEVGKFQGRQLGDLTYDMLQDNCGTNYKEGRVTELRTRTSIVVTILVITLLVSCIAVVLGVLTYRRCVHKTPLIPQAVNPYRAIYNQGAVQSFEEGIDKEQRSPYEL